MQELLEEIDIQVTTARNGKEGFDLYSKQPDNFDLILSDMKMPEMGGEEFLKKIRHEISQDEQPLFLIVFGTSPALLGFCTLIVRAVI